MKLWGGRFSGKQAALMQQFNDSLHFDHRLYEADIQGSQAYAQALYRAGLLNKSEFEQMVAGLEKVRGEFADGVFQAASNDEDIHTAVERRLTELVGEAAGKLHTGRSRNDQVALDLRLYALQKINAVIAALENLQNAVLQSAEGHLGALMPGFTHLQPAQPVLYSHWIMSYFWMLQRDKERLQDCARRTAVSPLGSGAIAGTPFALDRAALAEDLGLGQISQNSMDAVSDRDFIAEFLFANALTGVHISRLAEDLVIFSSPGYGYVTVNEAYSTGSSLMPQKRNPDALELARGKSGRLTAALVNLLVVLKGLPSTYNKDMQEDKEPLFDSIDTILLVLPVTAEVVASLEINAAKMSAHLDAGMLATDLADYLVEKGMPFRQAHQKVGEVIRLSESRNLPLTDLGIQDLQEISPLFNADVSQVFDFQRAVEKRRAVGGTAPHAVLQQIEAARAVLAAV